MFIAITNAYIIYLAWFVLGWIVLFTMAKSRGRNPYIWGGFGAFAFLITLVVFLIVSRNDKKADAAA